MNVRLFFAFFIFLITFSSCEELIDANLNEADPRVFIEGQLTDLSSTQRIRVSRTVAFTESVNSLPIDSATVMVYDQRGRTYSFTYQEDGYYVNRDFKPMAGRGYALYVKVGQEEYVATSIMPEYIEVDSTGVTKENIVGEDFYFGTFKFTDPVGVANYYKYDLSINGGQFRFASVLNDKFNDGLYVTHQISDLETDLVVGDNIRIRRYCIDKAVFDYWNEYQSTNPGTAAPGNPTSNISNNALGYFSVSSAKEFEMSIEPEVNANNDN